MPSNWKTSVISSDRRIETSEFDTPDFDLKLTLESGQVFHWTPRSVGYAGLIGEVPVYVEQCDRKLLVRSKSPEIIREYFALDHPLAKIYATFPADEAMHAATEFCRGLRIIRQPPWECLATFITSSMKQVAHIRQMSQAIRQRFGNSVEFEGTRFFLYPTPERLAQATEAELRECRLGYRAKHLLGTARIIATGEIDLLAIKEMNDADAFATLCRLPGVGAKIANCVLLFAYGRLKAFPIDVWIERVLRETYFKRKRNVTAERLRLFSQTYFGDFGGYAQQYLFHHARTSRRKSSSSFPATASSGRKIKRKRKRKKSDA